MATTVAGAGAPERGLTVPESMAASLRNTTWMTDGGASGSSVRSSVSRFVWPYSADCTYQGSCGINSTEYLPGSRLGNASICWPGGPSRVGYDSETPGWLGSKRTLSGGPCEIGRRVFMAPGADCATDSVRTETRIGVHGDNASCTL